MEEENKVQSEQLTQGQSAAAELRRRVNLAEPLVEELRAKVGWVFRTLSLTFFPLGLLQPSPTMVPLGSFVGTPLLFHARRLHENEPDAKGPSHILTVP